VIKILPFTSLLSSILISNWAKLIIFILFRDFIKKSNITSLQSVIYAFFDEAKIDINNSLRLLILINLAQLLTCFSALIIIVPAVA
jgi:hypothetical protein